LAYSLGYQAYQWSFASSQLFWIGSTEKGCKCQTVNVRGKISEAKCNTKLPTLCTQSAPVSNPALDDTSAKFQVMQKIGKQWMTGVRDHFVWKFRGVRYANPPQRFEYSTVSEPTAEVNISAINFATNCLQAAGADSSVDPPDMSDDCLFLNVWTPYLPPTQNVASKKLKPVYIYLHGGGLATGASKNPNTDGTNLASRGDIVVIAANYRLTNLGFLVFNDGVHNGNYGVGDMITMLQWVKRNVAAFGGDPDRVTIAGASGGAVAVRTLLASPKAKGLFHNAVLMSEPGGWAPSSNYGSFMSLQDAYRNYSFLTPNATGCWDVPDQVACAKALSPATIANVASQF
jgi:carboxylesterase type B